MLSPPPFLGCPGHFGSDRHPVGQPGDADARGEEGGRREAA